MMDTIAIRDRILGIPRDRRIDDAHKFVVVTEYGQSIIVPVVPHNRVPIVPDDLDFSGNAHFAYLIEFITYDRKGSLTKKIKRHIDETLHQFRYMYALPLRILSYGATSSGRRILTHLGFESTPYVNWRVLTINDFNFFEGKLKRGQNNET